MKLLAVALVVLAALAACEFVDQGAPSSALSPVAGNPCGNLGIVCLNDAGNPSGFCCDEGETCGGGKYSVGCPAGACCDIRGIPEMRRQWPQDGGR